MNRGYTDAVEDSKGGLKGIDLEGDPEVKKRVMHGRGIVRSLPYNAKASPVSRRVRLTIEQVFFATIRGWTLAAHGNKKTPPRGKTRCVKAECAGRFLRPLGKALEWYHKRPAWPVGAKPERGMKGFIDQGWGKTTCRAARCWRWPLPRKIARVADRGRVKLRPRVARRLLLRDELLGIRQQDEKKKHLRVPRVQTSPSFRVLFSRW